MEGDQAIVLWEDRRIPLPLDPLLHHTFDELGLQEIHCPNWPAAETQMAAGRSRLLLIDPSLELANPKIVAATLPRKILVVERRDGTTQEAEEAFDADGVILKSHGVREFGFVFRRVLFPHERNRRTHPRTLTPISVEYTLPGARWKWAAPLFNLSLGGMFVDTPLPTGSGSRIGVTFDLQERRIEIEGIVVFQLPGIGMGVLFQSMTAGDLAALKEWLGTHQIRLDRRSESGATFDLRNRKQPTAGGPY